MPDNDLTTQKMTCTCERCVLEETPYGKGVRPSGTYWRDTQGEQPTMQKSNAPKRCPVCRDLLISGFPFIFTAPEGFVAHCTMNGIGTDGENLGAETVTAIFPHSASLQSVFEWYQGLYLAAPEYTKGVLTLTTADVPKGDE